MTLPRVLAVVGPTASGKSRLAVALAERLGLPVLCCDSVQVYRGLDIGSAKVDRATRERVRHELIDLVDPDQDFSAGDYAAAAWAQLARGPGLFAGGTGFYLRAVALTHSGEGAADAPLHDPERAGFAAAWEARERDAPGAVHGELARRDPLAARAIHPRNVVRALRALWLCERHGRPVSQVREEDPPRARCVLGTIVLDPDPEVLGAAIDARTGAMLRAGLVEEVSTLVRAGYDARHRAMRSLGYRQILDHLGGRLSLSEAAAAIQRETRAYARRQRTYLRHQLAPTWTRTIREPIWLGDQIDPRAAVEPLVGPAAEFLGGADV